MFEKYGKPTWYIDRHIYTFPLHMALKFNTMLLVYGENVSYEYGGNDDAETYSAKGQIENGVASGMDAVSSPIKNIRKFPAEIMKYIPSSVASVIM